MLAMVGLTDERFLPPLFVVDERREGFGRGDAVRLVGLLSSLDELEGEPREDMVLSAHISRDWASTEVEEPGDDAEEESGR